MFKRNKKEEDIPVPEAPKVPDAESDVANVPIGNEQPPTPEDIPKPELTEQDKAVLAEIKAYKEEYGEFYSPNDTANIPFTVLKAEELNLSFVMVMELRKLRRTIEQMK